MQAALANADADCVTMVLQQACIDFQRRTQKHISAKGDIGIDWGFVNVKITAPKLAYCNTAKTCFCSP